MSNKPGGMDVQMLNRISLLNDGDGGGGGGATPIASSGGNIFELNGSFTGPGDGKVSSLDTLDIQATLAGDVKNFMESGAPLLDGLFGKISAGSLLPTIDYLGGARSIQPMNLVGVKHQTFVGKGQG
jgi:hypothetical protein